MQEVQVVQGVQVVQVVHYAANPFQITTPRAWSLTSLRLSILYRNTKKVMT